MVVTRLAHRAAAQARLPVFVAVGGGARAAAQDLLLRPELRLVDSPRHAAVLLVAGWLPRSMARALAQVHDQLPHPRATVWWTGAPLAELAGLLPQAVTAGPGGDVVATLRATYRDLLTGERRSDPGLLPDQPPAPWEGVGPHGQGGTGMMGGRPYGRPMAMTGPDRDGLELDRLALQLGPFFAPFPPGLTLDVVLQGDVVQEARVRPNPFRAGDRSPARVGGPVAADSGAVFRRALDRPVSVADLELARARHHLRWVATTLRLHGLPALARRCLHLCHGLDLGAAPAVARFRRRLEGARWPRWAMEGVGIVDRRLLAGTALGPVTRAAGAADDDRSDDAAYRGLGFEPVIQVAGDALARFRQHLAEAEQGVALAARAASTGRIHEPRGRVEGPRGLITASSDPSGLALSLLPDVLPGMEWGDAVTTLTGLDLDLEEAAGRRPVGVA